MTRQDRRDAGVLGLLLLALAFVVTPLVHQLDHGHEHQHGPAAPTAPHGAGSLEHQLAAFTRPVEAAQPVFFAIALPRHVAPAAPAPPAPTRFSVAQPQGP